MIILFDNNTPVALAHYLSGHDISRAAQLGWASYRNGDLLNAAEKAGFALLITCDQNLPYQQNMGSQRGQVIRVEVG